MGNSDTPGKWTGMADVHMRGGKMGEDGRLVYPPELRPTVVDHVDGWRIVGIGGDWRAVNTRSALMLGPFPDLATAVKAIDAASRLALDGGDKPG